MNEEINIKPINENPDIKKIEEIELPLSKQKEKEDKRLITNLPTWSIEPPIEIKRGNE